MDGPEEMVRSKPSQNILRYAILCAIFGFNMNFTECKNGELPLGWEEVVDPRYGKLFINHLDRQVQVEDPRTQYLGQKEQMIANFIS